MSLWQRLFGRPEEKRAMTLRDADGWITLAGGPTAAGVTVTAERALGHPAVLGAVRLLAELTASLPLLVYRREGEGKVRAEDHPVYRLLHEAPNPQQTPFTFKETVALQLLLYGNAYVLPEFGDDGRPVALWPLHPSRVAVEEAPSGAIVYRVQVGGRQRVLSPEEIIHVPMLPLDGLQGRSPILLAREAIGAALAAEEHAARYFANAALPSGIIRHPGVLDDEAYERLKTSWQENYGRGKAGTAILEDGAEFQVISANAQQAQLIEARQHAMRSLAAALRIPAHLLDPTARGTYANVETQSLEFLTFSLQPFLARIEQAFTARLFTPAERRRYFVEFLADAILRADTESRYRAYETAIRAGFMDPEEARKKENLPPRPRPEPQEPPAPEAEGRNLQVRAAPVHWGHRIQQKHRPRLEAAARRVVEREAETIRALAEQHLGQRDVAGLEGALADYAPEWVAAEMAPAIADLAREAQREAAAEVGGQAWPDDTLQEVVTALAAAYAARHVAMTRATVLAALRGVLGGEAAVLEALDAALTDMVATRPGKVAALEAAELANEVALRTYREAGVTRLRWVAGPGSCEFCRQLDGKTVDIGQPFVAAGEAIPVVAGGKRTVLQARQPRLRPPIHLGCTCSIAPA